MDFNRYPTPTPPRSKAFLIGFALSLCLCFTAGTAFLACTGYLGPLAQHTLRRTGNRVNPSRIDPDAVKARLRRLAGADLTFPLPSPHMLVCKENKDLDLFSGERFIKRYKVTMANPPEGKFFMAPHDLPKGQEPLFIGLESRPTTTTTAAASRVFGILGANPSLKPQGTPAAPQNAPNPNVIALPEGEAAELLVATPAGAPILIEQ